MGQSAVPVVAPARGRRVLVVDDSRAMRTRIIRTLQAAGFGDLEVLEAGDGRQALGLARERRPELVLADLNMPEMDGLALIRALRSEGLGARCGLISSDAARVAHEALQAGALFVLTKPVTADGMRQALRPHLGEGRLGVPSAGEVSAVFGPLLGRRVAVAAGQRVVFASTGPVVIGLYEAKSEVAALLAGDLALAAAVAAAMAEAPPGRAAAIVAAAKLEAPELETLRECFSVCAALFGSGRVALQGLHTQLRSLPPRAVMLAVRPAFQGSFTVDVEGFGGGLLSVCLA